MAVATACAASGAPGNALPGTTNTTQQPESNQANYIFGASYPYCTTQNAAIDPSQCSLRPVGTFALTASPCGAFDMNGSVWEFSTPGPGAATNVRNRGGAWTSIASYLKGTYDNGTVPYSTASNVGFRLATLGL